ncbi:hypothetical protein KAR91_09565, partial [Candidatus Pacearchaeota archaeon]|nr:hypothetical protein [Candidatus Pacearchaeota archaeon]
SNNGTTEKYHFAPRVEAVSRVGKAIAGGRLDQFGEALHTFQDTFSHGGITKYEHAALSLFGQNPDITRDRPERAMAMANSSFNLLRGYNALNNGMGSLNSDEYQSQTNDIWNAISPYVSQFTLSGDKANTAIGRSASLSQQNAQVSSDGSIEKKEESISSSK